MQVLTPRGDPAPADPGQEDGCFELLLLELSTGLRRGEILALQWDDLDFRTGTLRVERQVQRIQGETGGLPSPRPGPPAGASSCPPPRLGDPGTVPAERPVPNGCSLLRKRRTPHWFRRGAEGCPPYWRQGRTALPPDFTISGIPFATSALEHGMDIKTLSTIIGHVSSTTTLNTYTHITDAMRRNAADKIDRASPGQNRRTGRAPPETRPSAFQPSQGKRRKPGTGCVSHQRTPVGGPLLPHLQWPAHGPERLCPKPEAECEGKPILIREMKAEIAAGRRGRSRRPGQVDQGDPGPQPLRAEHLRRPIFFCLWLKLWSCGKRMATDLKIASEKVTKTAVFSRKAVFVVDDTGLEPCTPHVKRVLYQLS